MGRGSKEGVKERERMRVKVKMERGVSVKRRRKRSSVEREGWGEMGMDGES